VQNRAIESYWRFIASALDRLLACLEGRTEEELNWRPLPTANSLYGLALHTLANTEENILAILCGQVMQRNREAEFAAQVRSPDALRAKWQQLRDRLSRHLAQVSPTELDQERDHPRRGSLTGREVLLVVARHTTEHLGQAELTRDLLRAQRE
jgi:uncharacterized damage-inducible protein DinB